MLIRIKKKINREGYKGLVLSIFNSFLVYFFNLKIHRNNSIKQNRIAKKIFLEKTLKYSNSGFFYISPMPNKEELNQYYKSAYWESRENINLRIILNRRDLIHFKILKNLFPQSIAKKKVFLNFGSGHGGVSHLLHDLGLEIINIEQGEMPNYYNKNWSKFSSTKSIKDDSVDVIYSSHSLEHVQNINEVQNEFKRIIKPEGILFFEVPNADSSSTGPKENKIVIPHTYYFQKIFFKNWFSKAILVKSFIQNDYEDIDNFMSYENPNGEIIIAIGVLH